MAAANGAVSAPTPISAGSVSFKAYLLQNGADKPKEVRRFGMEQNEVTSFDLLKKKLRQVFPSLAKHEFSVSWKDFEEDDIIISSNEELLTALTETTDQVRRLYLTQKNPISISIQPPIELKPFVDFVAEVSVPMDDGDDVDEDEDVLLTAPGCKRSWHSASRDSKPKIHPNVYCDGCNKTISSHRYKCLECDDFDLCIDCESKTMHKDHVMLRIPLSKYHFPMFNHFSKNMHHISDSIQKIGSCCKKQERRMHKVMEGHMKHCDNMKRYDDLLGMAGDMIHHSKRCKRDSQDKKDKKDKKKEHASAASCSAATAGASASASASASTSDDQHPPSDEYAKRGRGCPFPTEIFSSFLNPQTIGNLINPQHYNKFQKLLEQMSPVPEQLLQEVAQNLADVRLEEPTAPASATASPQPNPFSVNSTKAPSASESDNTTPSTSAAPQPSAPTEIPKSHAVAPVEANSAPAATSQPEASSPANAEDALNQSGRSSRSSSEEQDEGWMVVDSRVRNGNPDGAPVYPKLPAVEPTPEPVVNVDATQTVQMPVHRDPEVQKCLRSLVEMGYECDQVIVDVAEQYKGNLSRVLNCLLS